MNYYGGKGLYQLRGHILNDKEHYILHIRALYYELYGIRVNIRDMPSTGVVGFQLWSNALISFKHETVGLPLGKKTNVNIPGFIDTEALFFAFLRGLFDTDGSIWFEKKKSGTYPRIEISTVSANLAEDIHARLVAFGFKSTLSRYIRPEERWNDLYSVTLRGFEQVQFWSSKIDSNNPDKLRKIRIAVARSEKMSPP
ncbi:MAG: LAGLIDADG family homing endonuclease [Nanoarchaeota archaeon]